MRSSSKQSPETKKKRMAMKSKADESKYVGASASAVAVTDATAQQSEAATGASDPQAVTDANKKESKAKLPTSPRGPLTRDDCCGISSDEEEPYSQTSEGSSDEESELTCLICKHRRSEEKMTTYTKGNKTFATCKQCRNTKNRIHTLVKVNDTYKRAWEAMGSQAGSKNSFISKCHHAMGEHLSANFDKFIKKQSTDQSLTIGLKVEGS